MPYYDYMCESCGTEFEVQRSMSDTSKVKCEACKSARTTKIFAATGIHFKGSGFYVTDSKGSGSNGAAKASVNGDSPSTAEKTTETNKPKKKADSKTDTKATSTTKKKKEPVTKK